MSDSDPVGRQVRRDFHRLTADLAAQQARTTEGVDQFEPVTRAGYAPYMHRCGLVEWWPIAPADPNEAVENNGCDACECAPDGAWTPLYRRVTE